MRGYLVIIIVACGVVAALRSRRAGLALYTWFALFRPQEWAYRTIDQYRLSFVSALALIVPALLTGTVPNMTHPLSMGAIGYLLIAIAAELLAGGHNWTLVTDLATLVAVSTLAVTILDTPRRIITFVTIMAMSLGVHGAYTGLLFVIRGGGQLSVGIGGRFSDNNPFALALVSVMFLLVAAAQNARWLWLKPAFLGMIPLTLVTIVMTYSRGAFLAIVASVPLFALLQRKRLLGMSLVLTAALLTAMLTPARYWTRVNTISEYEDERSAAGRVHFWRVAMVMAADNPMGVGLGNFERNYDRYDFSFGEYGPMRAVHSTHFQALAETGYVGFAVFEGLLAYSLVALWRMRRKALRAVLPADEQQAVLTLSNALIAATAAFMVGGSFLGLVLSDLLWLSFGAVAALDRYVARAAVPAGENVAVFTPESPAAIVAGSGPR
jgi:putative inorganic carbon (hco3(-)) transporter